MTPSAAPPDVSVAPSARRWTPRDALVQAIAVLRREGLRTLVARAAGETVYRRLVVMTCDLARAPDVVPDGLEFSLLREGDLSDYARLRPGGEAQAAERLAAGDRCVAAWSCGRLVGVRWLGTGSVRIEYLDLVLELADCEIYNYDAFTDEAFRRRGVASAIRAYAFALLRDEGYRRSVTAVLPENGAAVSNARNAGYRPAARIGYVRVGRWRRTFRRAL